MQLWYVLRSERHQQQVQALRVEMTLANLFLGRKPRNHFRFLSP